jgi:hypothetical protein
MDNDYHRNKFHLLFNSKILPYAKPTRHTSIISVQVKAKKHQKRKICIQMYDQERKSLASISLPNSRIGLKKDYLANDCTQMPFIKRLSDKASRSMWSNITINRIHRKSINKVKLMPLSIPSIANTSLLNIKAAIAVPRISRNSYTSNNKCDTHEKPKRSQVCLRPNIVSKCNQVLSILRKSRMHNQIY